MSNVPDWYELLLLSLAAWRIWHLLAEDDILDKPRRYVTRLGNAWEKEGDPTPPEYRIGLANFLTCPYCFGFWIGALFWGAWLVWPHETLVFSALWAISAGVIATAKILSSE
jgi:hypothetical protein